MLFLKDGVQTVDCLLPGTLFVGYVTEMEAANAQRMFMVIK